MKEWLKSITQRQAFERTRYQAKRNRDVDKVPYISPKEMKLLNAHIIHTHREFQTFNIFLMWLDSDNYGVPVDAVDLLLMPIDQIPLKINSLEPLVNGLAAWRLDVGR